MPFQKGYRPWNLGKTKDTNPILRVHSERIRDLWKNSTIYKDHGRKTSAILETMFHNGSLVSWNKGKTKETDNRLKEISQQARALWQDPDFLAKLMPQNRVRSEKMKGHPDWTTPQGIAKMRESQLRNWQDPNSIYNNQEFRRKRALATKESLRKPETLLKLSRTWHKRPTKFEKEFIEAFPNLKYTGNMTFWVGCKNPDFIVPNTNVCIDLFGDYWHDLDEVEERTSYFVQRGFSLKIFWESDWKTNREMILKQVESFIKESLTVQIVQYPS